MGLAVEQSNPDLPRKVRHQRGEALTACRSLWRLSNPPASTSTPLPRLEAVAGATMSFLDVEDWRVRGP